MSNGQQRGIRVRTTMLYIGVLVFAIAHRDLSRVAAAGTQDTAPRLLLTGVMLARCFSSGLRIRESS